MSSASTTQTAREQMLRRIREALTDVPTREQPDDVVVTRAYRHADPEGHAERIGRFVERVGEYEATVRRVERAELPAAIASVCAARSVRRLVVPADLPPDWLAAEALQATEVLYDRAPAPLSHARLEASDGVLTGCALGIAQTGTIVLDAGPTQGRRAITLIPDYHLCVVGEDQIVDLVPEAITRLSAVAQSQHRPVTFISGPSATSDIELSRVGGVHGPRTLHVLVVAGLPAWSA